MMYLPVALTLFQLIGHASEYRKQTQKLEPAAHGHRVEPNCMCTF